MLPPSVRGTNGCLPGKPGFSRRDISSVVLVDVGAKRVHLVELLVTFCTRVMMERDVLGDAGGALELCIAGGAGVCHYISNSRLVT